MKMDNRRVFVMLRPLETTSSYSGYARMELSGGRVQLTIAVQGFGGGGGPVYALLLGGSKAAILGKLVLDVRGQGGMQLNLNVNDVDGAPFMSYGVLAVGRDLGESFKINLAGSVGRGGWVDFTYAERLVFDELHPALRETIPLEEDTHTPVNEDKEAPEPAAPDETPPETSTAPMQAAEAPTESSPAPSSKEQEEAMYDLPAVESASTESAEDALTRIEQAASALVDKEASIPLPTALQRAFWPQSLWQLHDLFQRFPLDESFDRQGELFARVPLNGETWDHFLLGVRLDGNWITGAGYCVPASYGDPPRGFENASFMAARDGRGYYCLWEEE